MNQRRAGIILAYIADTVKALSVLFFTPVMLRLLGKSEYGLYQLVYSVVSYLGLLSLGFNGGYIRYYSRFKANSDDTGIAKLNGMFLVIFSVLAAICMVCGGVMIGNARAFLGEELTSAELEKAKILLALMVVNLAITFPGTVFESYVLAHEKFVFQKAVLAAQNLLNPFLTLPLLLLGYGSVGMVCVTTLLTVGGFILNSWFCFSKLQVRFLFQDFRFSLFREIWTFTFFIFLNQITDRINWSVDNFLLGRFIGTGAVAVYGVGSQISTMYREMSVSIANVFAPEINRIVAVKNDNRELTQLFILVGRVQFIILSLVLTGFIFFGKPFIRFWAGSGYEESYCVALLLIIPVTIPMIQNLGIEIQQAKNMHRARSVVYFAISVSNILISIPLIQCWGPAGAATGTAVSLLAGTGLFMNLYYHKKIGIDVIKFWKSIAGFIPALISPCAVGTCAMFLVNTKNLLILLMEILAYTVVFCLSMWFLGMNNEEKKIVKDLIGKLPFFH